MEIKNIRYKSTLYRKVIPYKDYILLDNNNSESREYYEHDILQLLEYYGEEILRIIPKDFIKDKQITEKQKERLINLFIDFYCDAGYIKLDTDIYNENNSFILIPIESILTLTTYIIRFYLFYELYLQFKESSDNNIIISKNMRLLLNDFNMKNYSRMFLLGTIYDESKKYGKKANIEIAFSPGNNGKGYHVSGFNIVSNDIYILGLDILSIKLDELLIDEPEKYIRCQICKNIIVRKNKCQKYCETCEKTVNYGEITKNNKIEIIKELELYSRKVHLKYSSQRSDLAYYCNLLNPGNSRRLLNTRKQDLLTLLDTVKEEYNRQNPN